MLQNISIQQAGGHREVHEGGTEVQEPGESSSTEDRKKESVFEKRDDQKRDEILQGNSGKEELMAQQWKVVSFLGWFQREMEMEIKIARKFQGN